MKRYKFVCSLNLGDVLAQTIVWLVLIVCTLGLALPFFMYFFFKLIINRTEIWEMDIDIAKAPKEPEHRSFRLSK